MNGSTINEYDPSLYAFTIDVERLCLFAETRGLEGLSDFIGWNLLYSNLRSRAGATFFSFTVFGIVRSIGDS